MTRLQGEVHGVKIIADSRMLNSDKPRFRAETLQVFTSVGGARELFEIAHRDCQDHRDFIAMVLEMHTPFDHTALGRARSAQERINRLRAGVIERAVHGEPPSGGSNAVPPRETTERMARIEAENRQLRERLSRLQDLEVERLRREAFPMYVMGVDENGNLERIEVVDEVKKKPEPKVPKGRRIDL